MSHVSRNRGGRIKTFHRALLTFQQFPPCSFTKFRNTPAFGSPRGSCKHGTRTLPEYMPSTGPLLASIIQIIDTVGRHKRDDSRVKGTSRFSDQNLVNVGLENRNDAVTGKESGRS